MMSHVPTPYEGYTPSRLDLLSAPIGDYIVLFFNIIIFI